MTRILGPLTAEERRVLILIAILSAGSFQKYRPSSFLPQVDILIKTNIVGDLGETGLLTYSGGALENDPSHSQAPRCQVPGGGGGARGCLRTV